MKGRFATQELIDLGFDPQFAAQAGAEFAKGPIQKQIVAELKKINDQEVKAAQALADLAEAERDQTETLRGELGVGFEAALTAAVVAAFKQSNPDATAEAAEKRSSMLS